MILKKIQNLNCLKKKSEHEFEEAALEHLGGSIAFVRDGSLYEENNK